MHTSHTHIAHLYIHTCVHSQPCSAHTRIGGSAEVAGTTRAAVEVETLAMHACHRMQLGSGAADERERLSRMRRVLSRTETWHLHVRALHDPLMDHMTMNDANSDAKVSLASALKRQGRRHGHKSTRNGLGRPCGRHTRSYPGSVCEYFPISYICVTYGANRVK